MNVMIPTEYAGSVVRKTWLSPKIILLQVKPDRPFSFLPGQYGSLLIDQYRRPLSFASLPTDETIDFVVDISPGGVCSTFTKQAQEGQTVRLLAPYGRFTLNEADARPLLFIATGSGIAPIRAQLKHALHMLNGTQPIHLFFGNRNEDYMFFTEEFASLAQHHPHFRFTPVLSAPSKQWSGATGLVTTIIPQHLPDLPNWSIYICGNPRMVTDMRATLHRQGVDKSFVHTEQF